MWNLLQISLLTMAEPYIYQSLHKSSPPEEPPHYSHRPLKKWLKCQCWKFQWFVYCLGPLLLKREAATKTSQGDEPQWKEVTISSGTCFLSAWKKKKKIKVIEWLKASGYREAAKVNIFYVQALNDIAGGTAAVVCFGSWHGFVPLWRSPTFCYSFRLNNPRIYLMYPSP